MKIILGRMRRAAFAKSGISKGAGALTTVVVVIAAIYIAFLGLNQIGVNLKTTGAQVSETTTTTYTPYCPPSYTCSDGSTISCSLVNNACQCGTCPTQTTTTISSTTTTQPSTTTTYTPYCPTSYTCPGGTVVSCSLTNNICSCGNCPTTTSTTLSGQTTTTVPSTTTTTASSQCSLGSQIPSSGCQCGYQNYNSGNSFNGYCCGTGAGYYSTSACIPNCAQGAIPSSPGCYCGRGQIGGAISEFQGYCCWGSYSTSACATTTQPCTDSDNGINLYVLGTGSGNYAGSATHAYTTYTDTCATSTQLNEAFCDSSTGLLQIYGANCGASGCKDGVCLTSTTTTLSGQTTTSTTTCPYVAPMNCGLGLYAQPTYGSNGCISYYTCLTSTGYNCPPAPSTPSCPSGQYIQ